MPPVLRHSITLAEKKALREYYASSPVRPSQRELIVWFQEKYQVKLPQSTVSSILSHKYKHLDSLVSRADGKKKQRPIKYPLLDTALFEWVQRKEQENVPITGEMLKRVAAQLWVRIPEYANVQQPEFSNGWLDGFKKRHSIKLLGSHSESGLTQSVAVIHEVTKNYAQKDVFCLDEIALLWKMIPSKPPEIEEVREIKRYKARITATLCCNATGEERLPLWVVGYSKFPRAFQNANVAVKALDFEWKHNGIAWMTTAIMEEWLLWFDQRMAGRNVLLLLDRFNPHLTAVANIRATKGFTNTTIQWLPSVSTGKYNPYEHGITQILKTFYRRSLLQFSIFHYELFQDPMKKMNVLRALRWLTGAWAHDVKPAMIQQAFKKSEVFKPVVRDPVAQGRPNEEDDEGESSTPTSQQRGLPSQLPNQVSILGPQGQEQQQQQQQGQHPLSLPSQHSFAHSLGHDLNQYPPGTPPPHRANSQQMLLNPDTLNSSNGGSVNSPSLQLANTAPSSADSLDRNGVIGEDGETLASLIEEVQLLAGRFASEHSMPFKLFLTPEEEEVVDCNDDILEQIASQFIADRDAETDEEGEPVRKITWKEASEGLEALLKFEEQQPNGQPEIINILNKHKRLIEMRKKRLQKQRNISPYFPVV